MIQLRYTPSWLARTDLKDDRGEVSMTQHDVTGTVTFPLPTRARLNVAVSRDHHQYRFRNAPEWSGLLEDAYSTQGTVAYMGSLTPDWSIFSMAAVRWVGEKGAKTDSSARSESGQVMLQRSFGPRLQWGVGLMAASRLDESDWIIPMASISWQINDRLMLRTMRGVHLLYTLDAAGKWQAGLNGEYFSRHYRLNDEGPAPGGTFRSQLVLTSLVLIHKPNPGIVIGAELGYVPWRELTVRDEDRSTVLETDTEPGLSAAFSASITF